MVYLKGEFPGHDRNGASTGIIKQDLICRKLHTEKAYWSFLPSMKAKALSMYLCAMFIYVNIRGLLLLKSLEDGLLYFSRENDRHLYGKDGVGQKRSCDQYSTR